MPRPLNLASAVTRRARRAAATVLGPRGIIALLELEHAEIAELIVRCERTGQGGRDLAVRQQVFHQLRTELEAHANAKALEVYPVLAEREETRDDARRCIHLQEEVGTTMEVLSNELNIESPEWMERFDQLKHEVLEHFAEEEQVLLPKARQLLRPERQREMERRFKASKRRALREQRRSFN